MTRVGRDFGNSMRREAVPPVSADVIFASSRFPNYKIGANNQIVEVKEDLKVLSMKEVVARETAQLLEQQKRLSVRDLASKFEKGLAAAAKLSDEVRPLLNMDVHINYVYVWSSICICHLLLNVDFRSNNLSSHYFLSIWRICKMPVFFFT